MQNNEIKGGSKSSKNLVTVENSLASVNCKMWTSWDWITKIISMPCNKEDFNVPQNAAETIESWIGSIGNDYERIVKMLLKRPDINVNLHDKQGGTALTWSFSSFTFFSKFNSFQVDDTDDALSNAVKGSYEKIVVLLLNHRNIDVNAECKNGCTALMYTIARGQNKVVELLLRHPKIDVNTKIPLLWDGDTETPHCRCNINEPYSMLGFTALTRAIQRNNEYMLRLKRNGNGGAFFRGFDKRTGRNSKKLFLEKGADSICLLNQPGIDVNARNEEGKTALNFAEEFGYRRIEKLIRFKIGPQRQQKKIKHTPNQKINKELLSAVSRGNIDKINSLLNEEDIDGAILVDVNNGKPRSGKDIAGAKGDNALIRAAKKGVAVLKVGRKWASQSSKNLFLKKVYKSGQTASDLVNAKIRILHESQKAEAEADQTFGLQLMSPRAYRQGQIHVTKKDLKEWKKKKNDMSPRQPERLIDDLEGSYSRRINKQDRLVYEVDGEKSHYEREKKETITGQEPTYRVRNESKLGAVRIRNQIHEHIHIRPLSGINTRFGLLSTSSITINDTDFTLTLKRTLYQS
ncbi:ankyrin repeat-containing domain protein [Neocallimastix lanati (nom. inval.)]|nr:ankyrin repeat-containing domain protein [Neocallimastix sp. JGI-2020a]